jgi:nicotinamidase/pyrazinamidase
VALVVVDLQNDFCPGGALGVREGDKVVAVINVYIEKFTKAGLPVIATRDWHPPKTSHFKEFGGPWPVHCVEGTRGAEFHPALELPEGTVIITKGDRPDEDAYSCFQGRDPSGRAFAEVLKSEGVCHIYIGGPATDYCVKDTALDAAREGVKVTLLKDAVRGVDLSPGDTEKALEAIIESGADTITLGELQLG